MTLPPISLHFDTDLPLAEYFDVDSSVLPDPEVTPGPVEQAVAGVGETAVLIRCLVAAFDDYDSFDPAASSWNLRLVKALVSSPSEKESRDLAGRGITATRRATLGEYLRLRSDREGNGDLIVEVPDARVLGVSGSGATWNVLIAFPDVPAGAEYAVDFTGGIPTITGLNRDEYRVHRIAEVRRDRHPFTGVTKLSVYLQEVVG